MNKTECDDLICDRSLAQKLERAEGLANAGFVQARCEAFPETKACWEDFGGTYAMFDGVDSPCTQTFGLGMFLAVGETELDEIEAFFQQRGATVFHEVCPMIDDDLLRLLNQRGYQPIEYTNVNYRSIAGYTIGTINPSIQSRLVEGSDYETWAGTAAKGWYDIAPDYEEYLQMLAKVNPLWSNTSSFLAEIDGAPVGAAAISIGGDVALLAGACTVPEFRNRGVQRQLFQHRLQFAAEQGCILAVMVAQPGSASQRNAQRQGFQVAYTRTKWELKQ